MFKPCKNCGALYLKDFYTDSKDFNGVLVFNNVDDIFRNLIEKDIKEVIVDNIELAYIVGFIIANSTNSPENYKLLREAKIDKFMGIKLKLDIKK